MSRLRNVTYTPIINRKKTESFTPSKGIRQGDPLSPYIFILTMELITHLINNEINNKNWTPYKFINKPPHISHLLFADDILLFAKANKKSIDNIYNVITTFSTLSGLNLNLSKSKVWVSKIVNQHKRNLIEKSLGIKITNDLGFDIGYPPQAQLQKL